MSYESSEDDLSLAQTRRLSTGNLVFVLVGARLRPLVYIRHYFSLPDSNSRIDHSIEQIRYEICQYREKRCDDENSHEQIEVVVDY